MAQVYLALMRLSKLYQLRDFNDDNGEILAEWVCDEYEHYDLEVVLDSLRYPPPLNDPTWRLTPDTIRFWIAETIAKRVEAKMKKESQARQDQEITIPEISESTSNLINEYVNKLATFKPGKAMPADMVKALGREKIERKAASAGMPSGTIEDFNRHELHLQYIRENYDPLTGKPLPGWMPENEWLKK